MRIKLTKPAKINGKQYKTGERAVVSVHEAEDLVFAGQAEPGDELCLRAMKNKLPGALVGMDQTRSLGDSPCVKTFAELDLLVEKSQPGFNLNLSDDEFRRLRRSTKIKPSARAHILLSSKVDAQTRSLIGMHTRDMDTVTAATLVPQALINSWQHAIYSTALLARLGVTVTQQKFAEKNIIAVLSQATTEWLPENGEVTLTDITDSKIEYSAYTVACGVSISRRLAKQAGEQGSKGEQAESEIQKAFLLAIREEAARSFLDGSGVSNEPTGILGTTGLSSVDAVATSTLNVVEISAALEALEDNGIERENVALLCAPDVRNKMAGLYGENPAWRAVDLPAERKFSSRLMPAGVILLGDFGVQNVELKVGDSIDLSMVRQSAKDERQLYAFHDLSPVVREVDAFVKVINAGA